MPAWEQKLVESFEEDLRRINDYTSVDIEFREWLLDLFRDLYAAPIIFEEDEEIEHGEPGINDDSVHDDRICDRECLRTEQDQGDDREAAEGYFGSDEESDDGEREREEFVIEADIIQEENEYDPFEEEYEKIDSYKNEFRARKRKAYHKRKK